MKRIVLISFFAFICGVFLISCVNYSTNDDNDDNEDKTNIINELQERNKTKISITEGIWGTLIQREGDCMPGIVDDERQSTCKHFPVEREIVVYEYTTSKEAVLSSDIYFVFYEKVYTELVAITASDEEGFYELELKPGKYSVFIKEKGFLYASRSDGQGGINPVTVETSEISELNLTINYASD